MRSLCGRLRRAAMWDGWGGDNKSKANSAQLELKLGLSLAIVAYLSCSTGCMYFARTYSRRNSLPIAAAALHIAAANPPQTLKAVHSNTSSLKLGMQTLTDSNTVIS